MKIIQDLFKKLSGCKFGVAFTGHRPDKFGGYDESRENILAVKASLALAIERIGEEYLVDTWITGGALGVDTWAAELIQERGLHHTLAIPFKNYDERWPYASKLRAEMLYEQANKKVIVCGANHSPGSYQKRNEYMVDRCKILVAIWDGSNGGTANCVRYAKKKGVDVMELWSDKFR